VWPRSARRADANLREAQGMPGAGLICAMRGKALSERPAFQPYWGKPAVRNDRGGGGNGGIIRSPLTRHHLTRPNHTGSESCGAAREGGFEALTGEGAGRVSSREKQILRDADAVRSGGRQHRVRRYCEAYASPAWSQTPRTYRNTTHGNREIPRSPRAEDALGRIGKSEDVRR
jgi:hypothetical protein